MYDAIVYDGIADALDRLCAARWGLFVATAKPHYYARPILERFDLARRLAGIHHQQLDGTNDHKARLIAHIVAKEGVRPEAAIIIGDREFDVVAAARNGIRTIGVTWGYGSRAELRARPGAASPLRGAGIPGICDPRVAARVGGPRGRRSTHAMQRHQDHARHDQRDRRDRAPSG